MMNYMKLLDMTYRDKRAVLLLSILFPHVDLNNQFHIDHVFPRSRFWPSKLTPAGFSDAEQDEMRDLADTISNLQFLDGQLNQEKKLYLAEGVVEEEF